MTKITIKPQLQLEDEWHAYFSLSYSTSLIEAFSLSHGDRPEAEAVIQYFSVMERSLDRSNPEYQLLFAPIQINENKAHAFGSTNIAGLVIRNEWDGSKSKHLLRTLNFAFSTEHKTIKSLKNFLIGDSELSYESKYRLLLAIDNSDELYERYRSFMVPFYALNHELSSIVSPLIEHWAETTSLEMFEKVEEKYQLKLDHQIQTIDIFPSISGYSAISLTAIEDRAFIYWGYDATRVLQENQDQSNAQDRFLNIAKLISDKTKLEILKYCLDEARYGTQIAQHLNISGATVSHHMSSLSSENYVTISLQKKRVYYQTNQKRIFEELDLIHQVLKDGSRN